MIYKAVKHILENDSTLSAAIGTDDDSDVKIYPINPRKKVELPFIVFNLTDQRGNPSKDIPSGIDETRVQVIIYDTELDDVIYLAGKVRDALDGEKAGGTYNGTVIHSIDFDNQSDGFAQDYGNRGAIYIEQDYIIWNESN